jgi:undecaprenyl-diphosphatase
MIENLIELDQRFFLLLNGAGNNFCDPIMLFITSTWIWVPVYFFLAYFFIKKSGYKGLINLGIVFITLLITDQASVHLFKEVFERLRPCHDPAIQDQVRLVVDHCGGQFGFVSSHATNSFGLMTVSAGLVRKRSYSFILIFWALIVSYSRIYVGVHYPGDIIGGLILGIALGLIILLINSLIRKYISVNGKSKKT